MVPKDVFAKPSKKATDQIRAWDLFQAKAELWLAREIKEEIQYSTAASKFNMGADAENT